MLKEPEESNELKILNEPNESNESKEVEISNELHGQNLQVLQTSQKPKDLQMPNIPTASDELNTFENLQEYLISNESIMPDTPHQQEQEELQISSKSLTSRELNTLQDFSKLQGLSIAHNLTIPQKQGSDEPDLSIMAGLAEKLQLTIEPRKSVEPIEQSESSEPKRLKDSKDSIDSKDSKDTDELSEDEYPHHPAREGKRYQAVVTPFDPAMAEIVRNSHFTQEKIWDPTILPEEDLDAFIALFPVDSLERVYEVIAQEHYDLDKAYKEVGFDQY